MQFTCLPTQQAASSAQLRKVSSRNIVVRQGDDKDTTNLPRGYEANFTPGKGNIIGMDAAPMYAEGSKTDNQLNSSQQEAQGMNPIIPQFGAILVLGLIASATSNFLLAGSDMKDVKTLIEYRDQFVSEMK